MNTKLFLNWLGEKAESFENFNSNNAWGFGGAYGTKYFFPYNIVVVVATACYRHSGTQNFIRVDINGATVLDKINTSKARSTVQSFVQKTLGDKIMEAHNG